MMMQLYSAPSQHDCLTQANHAVSVDLSTRLILSTLMSCDMDIEEMNVDNSPSKNTANEKEKKLKKTVIVNKSKDGKRGVIYLSSIAPGEFCCCFASSNSWFQV